MPRPMAPSPCHGQLSQPGEDRDGRVTAPGAGQRGAWSRLQTWRPLPWGVETVGPSPAHCMSGHCAVAIAVGSRLAKGRRYGHREEAGGPRSPGFEVGPATPGLGLGAGRHRPPASVSLGVPAPGLLLEPGRQPGRLLHAELFKVALVGSALFLKTIPYLS